MKYFQYNQYQNSLSEKNAVNSPFAYSSYALSSGVGAQAVYTQWASTATLEFHYNTSGNFNEMREAKGLLGEKLMHDILTETGGWVKISPAGTRQGIDGLYIKFGKGGRIQDVLVGEAKYGSSQLQPTVKSGKQMSQEWISPRLKDCSRKYAILAKKIGSETACFSVRRPPKGAKIETVPLNQGQARIWQKGNKVKVYVEEKPINLKGLKRQCKAIAKRLSYGADRGMFRARLFRYEPKGDTHQFEIWKLDKYGNRVGTPQKFSGKFNDLLPKSQYILRKNFKEIFQNLGLSDENAKIWAEKCCENPAYFEKFQKISRWSIKYGPHVKIFAGGLMSGILSCSIDAGIQFLRNGDIDIRHSLKIGALSLISFIGGTYTSVHLHWVFTESKLGQKLLSRLPWQRAGRAPIGQALSRLGGNLATVAIFAYGGWLIGHYNFNTANRQMVAAGIGAIGSSVFYSGTVSIVGAFATAGTGTAIETLSGIAAYNATMAWIGGGTLSAGGLGVSGGIMVLSGGTFILAIGLATGVNLIFRRLDANSQKILIKGKVSLIEKRVEKGEQPEWEHIEGK
jgi:hypothetical protein